MDPIKSSKSILGLLAELKGIGTNTRNFTGELYDKLRRKPGQTVVTPSIVGNLLSGTKNVLWSNRSPLGKIGTAAGAFLGSAAFDKNPIINWASNLGGGDTSFDPSKLPYRSPQDKANDALQAQLGILQQQYQTPDYTSLANFYAQFANTAAEKAKATQASMSGGVNANAAGKAVNDIYQSQAQIARDVAAAGTGSSTSGLAPVSGSNLATPDNMSTAGKALAQYIAQTTALGNSQLGAQSAQLGKIPQQLAENLALQLQGKVLDSTFANQSAYQQAAAQLVAQNYNNTSGAPTQYQAPDKAKYAQFANSFLDSVPDNQKAAVIASIASPAQQAMAKQYGLSDAELYAAVQMGLI